MDQVMGHFSERGPPKDHFSKFGKDKHISFRGEDFKNLSPLFLFLAWRPFSLEIMSLDTILVKDHQRAIQAKFG